MPLPSPEIRDKAIAFSRKWQNAESERAEAQTFCNEFFAVFGVPRRRVASFEEPVKKLGAKKGRLHDQFKAAGYTGHDLEVLLVRLVFCLFADDTGIFSKQSFRDWLEARTDESGSCLISFRSTRACCQAS